MINTSSFPDDVSKTNRYTYDFKILIALIFLGCITLISALSQVMMERL